MIQKVIFRQPAVEDIAIEMTARLALSSNVVATAVSAAICSGGLLVTP